MQLADIASPLSVVITFHPAAMFSKLLIIFRLLSWFVVWGMVEVGTD